VWGSFLSGHCPLSVSRVFPVFLYGFSHSHFHFGRVIGPPASPPLSPTLQETPLSAPRPAHTLFQKHLIIHSRYGCVCVCVRVSASGWACVHLCACCVEFFHFCSFGHLQFILVISQHSARIRHLICLQNGTNLLILMRLPFSYIV